MSRLVDAIKNINDS